MPNKKNSQQSANSPTADQRPAPLHSRAQAISDLKARYSFDDKFALQDRLTNVFRRYTRRTAAKNAAGTPTEQRKRIERIANSGVLPDKPQAIDITRLALSGMNVDTSVQGAAIRAVATMKDTRGRIYDAAADYLIRELALIYLNGTGCAPTLHYIGMDDRHDSPFLSFCRDCMSIGGIPDNTANGLRNRISNILIRMTEAGLRKEGGNTRKGSRNI